MLIFFKNIEKMNKITKASFLSHVFFLTLFLHMWHSGLEQSLGLPSGKATADGIHTCAVCACYTEYLVAGLNFTRLLHLLWWYVAPHESLWFPAFLNSLSPSVPQLLILWNCVHQLFWLTYFPKELQACTFCHYSLCSAGIPSANQRLPK